MKNYVWVLLLITVSPLGAQENKIWQSHGPRVGAIWVLGKNTPTTIFGYHMDASIESATGFNPVVQFDGLIGGLERGEFFSTATVAIGARHKDGFEAGVGPMVSFLGTGVILVIGYNFKDGEIRYPVNIALGFSADDTWISLLSGFNFEK